MPEFHRQGAEPVVLASGSAVRARMLRDAGLPVDVFPASVDEESVKDSLRAEGADAWALADTLAEMKAARVSAKRPEALVIGCDQVLTCEGAWFDKPKDKAGAADHLRRLRGRSHQLISAAVIVKGGERLWGFTDHATLLMRPLSDTFIANYLAAAGDDVCASVGAYQLEGLGAQLFQRIDGDFFTILGMPLISVLEFLRNREVLWR